MGSQRIDPATEAVDWSLVPDGVVEVCRTLQRVDERAYVVGGAARDLLLGRPVNDWDVTTSAVPACVQRCFRRTIPTGIKHGTVTVLIGEFAVEVTTFRGEVGYTDGRHPDRVEFVDDLALDLERRDFTINAIALDPIERQIVDPQQGVADLERRLVRAVGDPTTRFSEDGLRAMRAVRLAAVLEFELDPSTLAAIAPAIEVFRQVSAERVRDELLKLLRASRPSNGVEFMRRSGLLDEVLPELAAAIDLQQNQHHVDDVYRHSLATLDRLAADDRAFGRPADGVLRLAALLHDVGKPQTAQPREDDPRHNTFHSHEVVGASTCEDIARRLKLSNAERERLRHLVRQHQFTTDLSRAAIRRFIQRVGVERLDDLFKLRAADLGSRDAKGERVAALRRLRARVDAELQRSPALGVKDLAVDGHAIIARTGGAGPHVGRIMRALLERVTDDPSLNTAPHLLALVDQWGGDAPAE